MVMLGITSLTSWVQKLTADSLLAMLIGCTPDSLPPLGSYFDFMDRLWTQSKDSQKTGRKDLFPKDKKRTNIFLYRDRDPLCRRRADSAICGNASACSIPS